MRVHFTGFDPGYAFGRYQAPGQVRSRSLASEGNAQAAVAARSKTATSLDIRTADGDRVTISLRAGARLQAYARTGEDSQAAGAAVSTWSSMQLKVEGELSDAEVQDLTELMNALGAATAEAQQTGSVDLAALAESFQGMNTLASFDYSYRQQAQAGAMVSVTA